MGKLLRADFYALKLASVFFPLSSHKVAGAIRQLTTATAQSKLTPELKITG